MLMKNKGVIENEASVAPPASSHFVPYVQGIAADFQENVETRDAGWKLALHGKLGHYPR
jgi:hypothetical protein